MYNLGIDIGGTNIAAGIVNNGYNIIKKCSIKTPVPCNTELICDNILNLCFRLLDSCHLSINDIAHIGIGVPGTVNHITGVVEFCANLFLHNWELSKIMANKFNKKVYVENDANAATLAEHTIGSAHNFKNAIVLTIGTGIGAGIITSSKLLRGVNFNAGEIGHMVIYYDGLKCSCGRKGCFEKYASASALVELTKEAICNIQKKDSTAMWELTNKNIDNISGITAFKAAEIGDKLAQNVLNKYFDYLSCGIVNIINIFQPEVICIGGGISNEKEKLLLPVKKRVQNEIYSKHSKNQTEIKVAKFGNDAGIIGASMLYKLDTEKGGYENE